MSTKDRRILQTAIEHYGAMNQVKKLFEEISELEEAIIKHHDGRDTVQHIAEEIADVEIMLQQAKMIYHVENSVDYWKLTKLARLARKIGFVDSATIAAVAEKEGGENGTD